jgi:hypothetical protein
MKTGKLLKILLHLDLIGGVRRSRWLAPWKDSLVKLVVYHCVSRVVDRRFVFGDAEREQFRIYLRMYENFTGCRIS